MTRDDPSPAECEALFAAVLVNDVVDPDLVLPDGIAYDRDAADLSRYFQLSLGLWRSGVDRRGTAAIAAALWRGGTLDEADRIRFKHVRARFKNLRFAHALYAAGHRYPPLFDHVTTAMGLAQDAIRTGRRGAARVRALQLRALLVPPMFRALSAEAGRIVPTSPTGFRALVASDHADLREVVARPTIAGHAFHAARKIVSRHVAFWDTTRTLDPSTDAHRAARWLAAINGLMGATHDELVERRGVDPSSYRAPFVLRDDIRGRIAAFLDRADIAPPGRVA